MEGGRREGGCKEREREGGGRNMVEKTGKGKRGSERKQPEMD